MDSFIFSVIFPVFSQINRWCCFYYTRILENKTPGILYGYYYNQRKARRHRKISTGVSRNNAAISHCLRTHSVTWQFPRMMYRKHEQGVGATRFLVTLQISKLVTKNYKLETKVFNLYTKSCQKCNPDSNPG
jgi:hypothetical protein